MPVPKKVAEFDSNIKQVACGGSHTAFVTKDNDLWMCGRGRDGQLGRGIQMESTAFKKTSPVQVPDIIDSNNGQKVQLQTIALGSNHTVL